MLHRVKDFWNAIMDGMMGCTSASHTILRERFLTVRLEMTAVQISSTPQINGT